MSMEKHNVVTPRRTPKSEREQDFVKAAADAFDTGATGAAKAEHVVVDTGVRK